MTDLFDAEIRTRFERLAASVPVDSAALAQIKRTRSGSGANGRFARPGQLPVLVLVVAALIVTTLAGLGRIGPGATGTPIALLTAAVPSGGVCLMAAAAGQLAPHPLSGIGLAHADGFVSPVRWPYGFTASKTTDGAVLYDESGKVFAREGQRVDVGGGWGYIVVPVPSGPGTRDNEIFNVCMSLGVRSFDPETPSPSPKPDVVLRDGYVTASVDTGRLRRVRGDHQGRAPMTFHLSTSGADRRDGWHAATKRCPRAVMR